jgi:hypothetical protein
MRRSMFWALALTASLSVVGCKKNAEPEAAPVAQAPAPAVTWSWGPATFDGSRAEGNDGTLILPFKATNNGDVGLILDVVQVTIIDAAGEKVCAGKTDVNDKAAKGDSVESKVEIVCAYTKLPDGAELSARLNVNYQLDGQAKQDTPTVTFPFKR